MAVPGCTNPNAANYNPAATDNDGSCIYLAKVGGVCYYFTEVDPTLITDQSFTLSYSLETGSWVFFHDYIPDFYIGTRGQLFTAKDSKIWKHNAGPHGVYYDGQPKSFFVDIVFNYGQEVILNSIQWLSEMLNSATSMAEFGTFTHITVWNNYQCTGRIPITEYNLTKAEGERKLMSEFSFNDLKDIVTNHSGEFMANIFGNLRPIDAALDQNMSWYEQADIQSNYFILRLEYDNVSDKVVSLHSADASVDQSFR